MDEFLQAIECLHDEYSGFHEDFISYTSEICGYLQDLKFAFSSVQDCQKQLLTALHDLPPIFIWDSPDDPRIEFVDR